MGSVRNALTFNHVDTEYLDCMSVNMAVLLENLDIKDVRSPLGCEWHFSFDSQQKAPFPILHRTPLPDRIRQWTGCLLSEYPFEEKNYTAQILKVIQERNEPVLLVGDAYFMPWLPYFGREHQEHSFLIHSLSEDGRSFNVVDAYYNITEWGECIPGAWKLPIIALNKIIEELHYPAANNYMLMHKISKLEEVDVRSVLHENAKNIIREVEGNSAIKRFENFYRLQNRDEHAVREFVLACWFAIRSRNLHLLWLEDVKNMYPTLIKTDLIEAYKAEIIHPWKQINEFAYVLLRRVMKGKASTESCFDILRDTVSVNEVRIAQEMLRSLKSN